MQITYPRSSHIYMKMQNPTNPRLYTKYISMYILFLSHHSVMMRSKDSVISLPLKHHMVQYQISEQ